jgi:hypothetical protein
MAKIDRSYLERRMIRLIMALIAEQSMAFDDNHNSGGCRGMGSTTCLDQ